MKKLLATLAATVLAISWLSCQPAVLLAATTDFDGRKTTGVDAIRIRPWTAADMGGTITVDSYAIHDVTDHKGIYITAVSTDKPKVNGKLLASGKVVISNCDIGNIILQTHGFHIDAIKLEGNTVDNEVKPDLIMENVKIHDLVDNTGGDGYGVSPCLINGAWNTVLLHNVSVTGSKAHFTIDGARGGVVIDGCSGIFDITGRPGTIGTVTVRNSPNATVANASSLARNLDTGGWDYVNPQAKIVYETTAPTTTRAAPATIPTTVPAVDPDAEMEDAAIRWLIMRGWKVSK